MQVNTNTDAVGGVAVLAISSFFYFQLNDDFTPFGAFFPEIILPFLAFLGVILVIKGVLKKKESNRVIFKINDTMMLSMVVGAAWALLLNILGFILASFISISILIIRYIPKEKRTSSCILMNCLGTMACVIVFYFVFSRLLGVTLPVGHVFDGII
ncbi:tripartite tricarboxylate transporter TctB family protein [Nitratidesulfovibrio termitidis]|uniref:tripartite tricarboxylate transporter TctB family protein n=1 Tax=Nitratidesulfovibrio termitidis TaxID=42252 RepID=UPI00054D97C1|nr:tripartite tricarboxylate transporter TctB family protein [Nitratidesulfovibrio termitidis]